MASAASANVLPSPRAGLNKPSAPKRDYASIAVVDAQIREFAPSDEEFIVLLSLRAWAPVFASLQRVLGNEVFARLHADWRQDQEKAVRGVLGDSSMHVWVAEAEREPIGFVAATLHTESFVGEIFMLAVDPRHQARGVGTALTGVATDWLRRSGMQVAMVETGGDPGHAPARRVYDKAHYTALPVARYFKAL